MKKLFWFVFIFNLSFVFSQSETIQSVSPKNFYVADSVQVRYSFKSGVDFFSDLDKNIFQRELKISNLPGRKAFSRPFSIYFFSKSGKTFFTAQIAVKAL